MKYIDLSTPKPELDSRIKCLQAYLQKNNIDGAMILQNSDLFYFSGTAQQANLYVPSDGIPILMARKSFERAQAESALDKVVSFDSPKQIPNILKQHGYEIPCLMGMELDVLPANMYFGFCGIFDTTKIVDISDIIRRVRSVKSAYELNLIRIAAQFADKVAESVKGLLYEGITEIALAGRVEAVAREMGHQGIVRMRLWGSELFYGHLMAGYSAAVPSYLASPTGGIGVNPAIAQGSSLRPIKCHEPVLVDYTFAYNGYLADHTRIFSIGNLSDKLMKAHEAMLDIQSLVRKEAKPGVEAGYIYEIAIERAAALGFEENFMGIGDRRIRFVGHGLGIELDEYPFLAKGQKIKLEENMTVAIEPKAIFSDEGVVGIENTHVVTPHGLETLTHFPNEVVVLDQIRF